MRLQYLQPLFMFSYQDICGVINLHAFTIKLFITVVTYAYELIYVPTQDAYISSYTFRINIWT